MPYLILNILPRTIPEEKWKNFWYCIDTGKEFWYHINTGRKTEKLPVFIKEGEINGKKIRNTAIK